MIASQREALPHTDITQLLILGKSGDATDERDMVYAFYGLTYLTSSVTYSRTPEWLFVEICHMYITALRYVASYDSVHGLTEQQKSFQLMSILDSYLHGCQIGMHTHTHVKRTNLMPLLICAIPTSGLSRGTWPLYSASPCRIFSRLLERTSGRLAYGVSIVPVVITSTHSRYWKGVAVN